LPDMCGGKTRAKACAILKHHIHEQLFYLKFNKMENCYSGRRFDNWQETHGLITVLAQALSRRRQARQKELVMLRMDGGGRLTMERWLRVHESKMAIKEVHSQELLHQIPQDHTVCGPENESARGTLDEVCEGRDPERSVLESHKGCMMEGLGRGPGGIRGADTPRVLEDV